MNRYLVRNRKTGQYLYSFDGDSWLGVNRQPKAHRFTSRMFAYVVAWVSGGRVIRLLPRTSDAKGGGHG